MKLPLINSVSNDFTFTIAQRFRKEKNMSKIDEIRRNDESHEE